MDGKGKQTICCHLLVRKMRTGTIWKDLSNKKIKNLCLFSVMKQSESPYSARSTPSCSELMPEA